MAAGTTNIGFEEKLWQAADKLRSNMDAAEYKHVVLGLIFKVFCVQKVGDVIVPNQEKRKIPTQLDDFPAPTVNTYSLETTIAEKIDAILSLNR